MIVYEYKTGFCHDTTNWKTFVGRYTAYGWVYHQRTRHPRLSGWDVTFKRPESVQA